MFSQFLSLQKNLKSKRRNQFCWEVIKTDFSFPINKIDPKSKLQHRARTAEERERDRERPRRYTRVRSFLLSTTMSHSPLSLLFATHFTIWFLSSTPLVFSLKQPFRPIDILPILPRQVSWPILNSLSRSPIDILPTFVGNVSSPDNTLEWKGTCFQDNSAWMEFHNKSGSQFGGGTLHLKVCLDFGLFLFGYFVLI